MIIINFTDFIVQWLYHSKNLRKALSHNFPTQQAKSPQKLLSNESE